MSFFGSLGVTDAKSDSGSSDIVVQPMRDTGCADWDCTWFATIGRMVLPATPFPEDFVGGYLE